jgi:UDP-N-acetylglucosamine--N-acetylmuramyl-(pentapeptide) pyrophosphoryl-undecaprenol N-acetylglucosamine transferase
MAPVSLHRKRGRYSIKANFARMARTIMIMAGGTGGHVFPALAVADYLRERDWRVVWLGARTGMEAKLVPSSGYEMAPVRFSGLRGRGLFAKLLLPLNLQVAFWQSLRAIRAHRPDVVLGMGGYIAFPGGMMAALVGRPLAIHEQNSVAGLANRVLAKVADRTLVAFPNTLPKSQHTGNPVREPITRIPPPKERFVGRSGPLRLLVVGGSLGARALNEMVPQALALIPQDSRPQVTHQSGAKQFDELGESYARAGVQANLVAFIDDMAQAYADADLVVCRAGATTVAELAAAGVPAILVPFPFAVDDHQTTNARYLSDSGAAILIQQRELTPEKLAALLGELSRARLFEMAEKARRLGKPDATRVVAEACMELAK